MNAQTNSIPVVDVDNAFPAMVERPARRRDAGSGPDDVSPQVTTALRDILGWRPRAGDPHAFENALSAAFRLRRVEGHIEADYVPRGYAVQADLGAVTGGQASLYRRATIARSEALRILEGLVPLRADADEDDMDSYRLLVRNGVERLVDEIGAAGGPRIQMVDLYFAGLTGASNPITGTTADTVSGQLGALRERYGLVDANVNTVEEEGIRTAFWTLVDLISDLQVSWQSQRSKFNGTTGQGFLGTELIILSRLMEAAADQVEELEDVLDSVLITESERRTLVLDTGTGLTLDGLLTWLHDFLSHEGRTLAQDAGRDGIVSALAPMSIELVKTFKNTLADRVQDLHDHDDKAENRDEDKCCPVVWLPASCCAKLPAGMYAARTRIAVAGLCRLLLELARTAQRIGRWARPVIVNVTIRPVLGRDGVSEVEFRGVNFRSHHIPAFVIRPEDWIADDCAVEEIDPDALALALRGSTTADDESISGLFRNEVIDRLFHRLGNRLGGALGGPGGVTLPAESLPLAVIDGETGRVVSAPQPVTWPALRRAWSPLPLNFDVPNRFDGIKGELLRREPIKLATDPPDPKKVIVKKAAAQKAPAKKAPAKKVPAKKAPGGKNP